jgi:selenium metabolism protein YedF
MKVVDCRAMSCPAPVITVKQALAECAGEPIQVLLSEGPPRENVVRFARNRGYSVAETELPDGCSLVISGPVASMQTAPARTAHCPPVILISSDQLGSGPEELGRLLLKNFIITLLDMDELPTRLLFVNSGVLLTSEGSESLEALTSLAASGVEILSCGLCLDYFHCRDKLAVGGITNMFTIAETLLHSGAVITL